MNKEHHYTPTSFYKKETAAAVEYSLQPRTPIQEQIKKNPGEFFITLFLAVFGFVFAAPLFAPFSYEWSTELFRILSFFVVLISVLVVSGFLSQNVLVYYFRFQGNKLSIHLHPLGIKIQEIDLSRDLALSIYKFTKSDETYFYIGSTPKNKKQLKFKFKFEDFDTALTLFKFLKMPEQHPIPIVRPARDESTTYCSRGSIQRRKYDMLYTSSSFDDDKDTIQLRLIGLLIVGIFFIPLLIAVFHPIIAHEISLSTKILLSPLILVVGIPFLSNIYRLLNILFAQKVYVSSFGVVAHTNKLPFTKSYFVAANKVERIQLSTLNQKDYFIKLIDSSGTSIKLPIVCRSEKQATKVINLLRPKLPKAKLDS